MNDLEKNENIIPEESENTNEVNEEVDDKEKIEDDTNEVIEVENEEQKENEETAEAEEVMESVIEMYTDYNYRARKTSQMYYIKVKSHFTIYNIVMIICCLALVVYSIIQKSYFLTAISALAAAYLTYSVLTQESKVDKAILKFMKTNPAFRMNYAINNEKIRMSQIIDGEEQKGDVPWAYVQEVHYTDEYYFLYLQGASLIIDRKEECLKKGTKAELDSLIAEVCSLKPFKYYNKPLNIKYCIDDTECINVNEDNNSIENTECINDNEENSGAENTEIKDKDNE